MASKKQTDKPIEATIAIVDSYGDTRREIKLTFDAGAALLMWRGSCAHQPCGACRLQAECKEATEVIWPQGLPIKAD